MRLFIGVAGLFSVIAACSSSTTPTSSQFLYVANDTSGGMISKYALPFTSTSTPLLQFAAPSSVEIAQDSSGGMIVTDKDGVFTYFTAPITAASVPSATFQNGSIPNGGQMAIAANGDLYSSTQTPVINVFTAPFTNATVVSTTVSETGITNGTGLGFDALGNLYMTGYADGGGGGQLAVLAAPYTGTPVTATTAAAAFQKLAISGDKLFVAAGDAVAVYSLPLTTSAVADFSIPVVGSAVSVSVDDNNNLYVGCLATATVEMFSPPFSASSVSAATLQVGSTTTNEIFGILVAQ